MTTSPICLRVHVYGFFPPKDDPDTMGGGLPRHGYIKPRFPPHKYTQDITSCTLMISFVRPTLAGGSSGLGRKNWVVRRRRVDDTIITFIPFGGCAKLCEERNPSRRIGKIRLF